MSDAQDRSEAATPRRRREAKRKGQVARSRELVSAGLLLLGSLCLQVWASAFGDFFANQMRFQFQLDYLTARDPHLMVTRMGEALMQMLALLVPPLGLLSVALILLGMLPGGPVLVWDNLLPKLSRFNPLQGLGKAFSKQNWVELLKAVFKVLLIGCALWMSLKHNWDQLVAMTREPFVQSVAEGLHILSGAWLLMGLCLGLIALFDVPFQQWQLLHSLMMSKQEIKEERRNVDGNPEIKMRLRRMQFSLAKAQLRRRLPKADVVIVNPTHYSVALRYDQRKAKAPYVVAKGVDDMALRIRELAAELDKPILALPELTRAVYHSTRVDQEIPSSLYNAVAQVLSHVMQLKAYKAGRGKHPQPLANLPIPVQLLKERGKS